MIISVDESAESAKKIWKKLEQSDFGNSVILKPRDDGCSAGILRIRNERELEKYLKFIRGNFSFIPSNAIHHGHGRIDLPQKKMKEILIEEFIETDRVVLHHLKLDLTEKTGFIEVTCGVIGGKNLLHVFQPSQTVADMDVLSLEEKFMGGTGVNFTPPPIQYVSNIAVARARASVARVAKILGIEGYGRIDFFMHRKTGEIIIIEANTLPGLTPSTVFFHQGLAEKPPILPRELLEKIIELGMTRGR